MVPATVRVAFLSNPETSPQARLFAGAAVDAGQPLDVEVMIAEWKTPEEIVTTIMRLARQSNVGLIATRHFRLFLISRRLWMRLNGIGCLQCMPAKNW
jgi:hypothetical protein